MSNHRNEKKKKKIVLPMGTSGSSKIWMLITCIGTFFMVLGAVIENRTNYNYKEIGYVSEE